MSETDWEAAFHYVHRRYSGCYTKAFDDEKEEIVRRFTIRTKKDLPVKGLFWVREKTSTDWKIAQFSQQEIIGIVKFEDFGPHRFDNQWWREHALELEIGPEIMPPGDGNETIPS